MTQDERLRAYKAFFVESPAGQEFMQELTRLINSAHEDAEEDPNLARDYTQHARGVRQVIGYINGSLTEINRGKHM
jgi:hypothetical protein